MATIRKEILRQVERRAPRTICPSEVARALAAEETEWRALMPAVRAEAATLCAEGAIRATQRGAVVDPVDAKGPIRLGKA
ncbi:MAG: DUF3253 domain-containing protein [Pseudomonadota bacterium]